MIIDPSRTFSQVAAAMIWLGFDTQNTAILDSHLKEITDCMMMLADAAERGEIRYYDTQVVISPSGGNAEATKVTKYTFTLQSLMDFAKIKNHKLACLEGKPKNDNCIGAEKPLATTERNTLLAIIAVLCDYSAIKHQERGAASQLARLTDEGGASVSSDPVKRALEKSPHSLEAVIETEA